MILRILLTLSISLLGCKIVVAEQKVALLAAVTTYSEAQMHNPSPKYPEADARALGDDLVASGYEVKLLVGKSATRAAVLQALADVQKRGDQDGVLVLGFFGHGVQYGESAYFCPFDTTLRAAKDADGNIIRDENGLPRLEPDPESMVSMREILDALALSPAGNKLLLADVNRDQPTLGRGFGSPVTASALPENTAALFSCSPGEQSFESDVWKHGAFARAILDGFQEDAAMTANELSAFVRRRVNQLVAMIGSKQTVGIYINGFVELKLSNRR